MLSVKPYIVRAFYDWILDSDCTPIIVALADKINGLAGAVDAPDNELSFNISESSVKNIDFAYDKISFVATFSGVQQLVIVPMHAIISIYAEESDQGMHFEPDEAADNELFDDNQAVPNVAPVLRIIE